MIAPPLEEISIDDWHDFAAAHARVSVFHHRNWLELLMEQYGYRPRVFAIKRGGAVAAAVPFLETRGLGGRRKMISLPLTDWMEVLSDGPDTTAEMFAGLRGAGLARRYGIVVVRTNAPPNGEPLSNGWVRHELDATAPMDRIIAGASSTVGRNLAKARRSRLTFQRRTDFGAVESFYRLHLLTRKRLGVPIQPRAFFLRLARLILKQNLGFVGMVSKGNDAISAAVLLGHGQMMTYKYGASRPDALHMRPNDWLCHEAIRTAAEEGISRFDFGISRLEDEGLRRFKRKWGAAETPMHFEYIVGDGLQSSVKTMPLKVASLAIRYGPPILCRAIGSALYRYSP